MVNLETLVPRSPIPVTLLSGFLGSGKTTLLRHILTTPDIAYRIAVVVNDMAALNIDAALVKKHLVSQAGEDEKLIQLQNGCICCTLRGDLLEALVNIAKNNEIDYVVIESTGISEPMQVAETFTEEFADAMRAAAAEASENAMDQAEIQGQIEGAEVLKEISNLGGLHKIVRLDTLITMVDAFNFFDNFTTTDFITNRWGKEGVTPEDERTVTDLMVDQIEFANTIIINKIDSVDEDNKQRIRGIVEKLNPGAKILEAKFAQVDIGSVLATSAFDFEKAATGVGWLQSLHEMSKREVNGKIKFAPKPETEEYGISSFIYQARRPFHPKRLYQLIHDKFVLMENATEDEEEQESEDEGEKKRGDPQYDDMIEDEVELNESSSTSAHSQDDGSWESADEDMMDADEDLSQPIDPKIIAENKKRSPVFRGLLRSKGFFWLASRPMLHGAWSQAGTMLTIEGGEPWFCTINESEWPKEQVTKQSILSDFQEPWGDRRQELVLIGETLDKEALRADFDRCLLTPLEMKRWERIMRSKRSPEAIQDKLDDVFEDGFEDWPDPRMDVEEHGHSHAH